MAPEHWDHDSEQEDEDHDSEQEDEDPKHSAPKQGTFEEEDEDSEQESYDEEDSYDEMPASAAALARKKLGPRSPVKKRAPPSKDLGKNVLPSSSKAATKAAASSGAGRKPEEMRELYPLLAEEVMVLKKEHPGLFKREFGMIADSKARELEEEIEKQRYLKMRLRMKVANALMDPTE